MPLTKAKILKVVALLDLVCPNRPDCADSLCLSGGCTAHCGHSDHVDLEALLCR